MRVLPRLPLTRPLSRRMATIGGAALLTLLLLAGATLMGLAMSRQMKDIVSEQFNQQQLGLARLIASRIEDNFNLVGKELVVLNLSPSLRSADLPGWERRTGITLSNLEEYGAEEIRQINVQGNEERSLNRQGISQVQKGDFLQDPSFIWAREGKNKGKIFFGRIKTGLDEKGNSIARLHLAVPHYQSIPDQSNGGVFSGVLLLVVNVTRLVEKYTANIQSGKTGYSWVIDDQGEFLIHPEKGFVGENAFAIREKREPKISFDAINRIQKEKMLDRPGRDRFLLFGLASGNQREYQKINCLFPCFFIPKRT